MIGGFIVGGGGTGTNTIVVRALGPSLTEQGVTGALRDPTLDLYNDEGTNISSNDDWQDDADAQVIADYGLALSNEKESALIKIFTAGNYTAIVRGKDGATGVALIEAYNVQ
jgi:hypothetical protein